MVFLSHGIYDKTRKVFVYEVNGKLLLPVFTDIQKAHSFAKIVNEKLKNSGRPLVITNICENRKSTLNIFVAIRKFGGIELIIEDPQEPSDDISSAVQIEKFISQFVLDQKLHP
jgi:hypothetical protein